MLRYLKGQDGASAAEYALILGVIGMAVAASLFLLGENVASAFNAGAAAVRTAGQDAPAPASANGDPAGGGGATGAPPVGGGPGRGQGGSHANGGNGNGGGVGGGRNNH